MSYFLLPGGGGHGDYSCVMFHVTGGGMEGIAVLCFMLPGGGGHEDYSCVMFHVTRGAWRL